jgi:hypothetical protein
MRDRFLRVGCADSFAFGAKILNQMQEQAVRRHVFSFQIELLTNAEGSKGLGAIVAHNFVGQ